MENTLAVNSPILPAMEVSVGPLSFLRVTVGDWRRPFLRMKYVTSTQPSMASSKHTSSTGSSVAIGTAELSVSPFSASSSSGLAGILSRYHDALIKVEDNGKFSPA